MTTPDIQKKAFIRDDALVLYFDTAENPVVARFDLNSLVQANFEVIKKEPLFSLILRDFSGQQQDIAQFSSKTDAHQALYAILQALLEQNEKDTSCGKKSCCRKSSWVLCLIKWFFILFGIVSALYLAMLVLTAPSAGPADTTTTAMQSSVPAASAEQSPTTAAPEGEAVDLDSILPEVSPEPEAAKTE